MLDNIFQFGANERFLITVLFVISLGLSLWKLRRRWNLILLGHNRESTVSKSFWTGFRRMLWYVLGQRCNTRDIAKDDLAGLGHLFIFWGFIFLGLYFIVFLFFDQIFGLGSALRKYDISRWFIFIAEIACIPLLIALISGVIRRSVIKPPRLGPDFEARKFLPLTLLACLMFVCCFASEGIRLNFDGNYVTGPVSGFFAVIMGWGGLKAGVQSHLYYILWWTHYLILLGFIVYVPFSTHQHTLFAPVNILLKNNNSRGILPLMDLENRHFGVSEVSDFSWRQLLEGYACAQCGRCQDVCPAYASGKPLSPKKIIQDIRETLDKQGPHLSVVDSLQSKGIKNKKQRLTGSAISKDEIWACTTCLACTEACPVLIEHVDKIVEMRRHLVLNESAFTPEAKAVFKNMEDYGDPLGMGSVLRTEWTRGQNVKEISNDDDIPDLVLWVGCIGSFYDRNIDVLHSLTRALRAAGVNFNILGGKERCCGDPARRLGNEYLFGVMAEENVKLFKALKIGKILTICPHCFNSLKNEYPRFGSDLEVVHYTEFIVDLINKGDLVPRKGLEKSVTYQDPCYLGRYNGIYESPRKILSSIGLSVMEPKSNMERSFCCGGGGGHIFLQEHIGQRINELRVDQFLEVGAELIATACPYCLVMLDEGVKTREQEGRIRALDIMELVDQVI